MIQNQIEKMISRINLICYGLFILILLNDNLTFVMNILFNLIEGMKRKTNGNISINANRKNILLKFIQNFLIYNNSPKKTNKYN